MVTKAVRVKSTAPLIVVAALAFLQIFSPTQATKFVLWGVGGLVIVSYVWVRLMARGVIIKRQRRYGWAQVGDILEERFVMQNHSWVSVPWAEVRDYSNLPGYSAGRAVTLPPRRFSRWEKHCLCTQRGVFTLGPIEILMGDPFGLFEASVRHNNSETFVVVPAITPLPQLVNPRGVSRGSGRANLRASEQTTNASAVRTYVPGDALNRIHWRTTARRTLDGQDEFFVREYDLEPSGDVWLILDLDGAVHAGQGLASTEEYGVMIAASLAESLTAAHHAVGLIAYGQEPVVIWPQKGNHQLWNVLRALAPTRAVGDQPLRQTLKVTEPVLSRGTSAVIITPSPNPDWVSTLPELSMRGVHPTVVVLDPASFGGPTSAAAVVRAAMDVGAPVHVVDRSLRLEEIAAQQERERREHAKRQQQRDAQKGRRREADWVSVGQEGGAS